MTSQAAETFVTLEEAKDQCSIDPGLTLHDRMLRRLIGAAVDLAENYTQRSLGELLELNSPRDSTAVPEPDPKNSPACFPSGLPAGCAFPAGWDWQIDYGLWSPAQWHAWWAANPIQQDHSKPLRRDIHEALLLLVQSLFDQDPDAKQTALDMLYPYRIGMGVA